MQRERKGEEVVKESRVRYLETCLKNLGYEKALKAMHFVIKEMCVEKGFTRHNGSHYYYHLIDTTQDLINHGITDEDILTAMLLHDTIEDIDWVTYDFILAHFGFDVADYVLRVTKIEGVDYKIPENMDAMLTIIMERLGSALIKTSDRKHNFSTLRDASPEKKLRQAIETERHYIPFFKVCRKLYPEYSRYFFSAKTAIEPHLWEIKERYSEIESLKDKAKKAFEGWKKGDDVFTPMLELKSELQKLGVDV